ncbi:MAG: glycosyltransferase family 4 protein [Bacteroidales bacterium]|nr:glycosyltransferase family 4 protein [Bacteroidales bacterium]
MNGGKHFWNREKDIVKKLNEEFEIFLVINHSEDKNYSLSDIVDFCKSNEIHLKVIDYVRRKASNPLKILSDLQSVIEIRKIKPDLIYIESFGSPYFAIFASFLFKYTNTIIAILDYKLHPYTKNGFKLSEKFYRFIYLKFFNNYHLFSYDQTQMMKRDYPRKNINTIRLNLIGTDHLKSLEFPEISDKINFLFFGKIYYYKGVDILIKAANILAKKSRRFKITIAGSCDDFSYYKDLIEDINFFDLKLYYLDKNELPALFSNADFFVAPYREVTQSGPLMMAFNYRILPIVSDLAGFKEHISEEIGFIFKNDSPEDLAIVMERAMNISVSERNALKKNLGKYVESEFNINTISSKYIILFNEVINNQKTPV